MEKASLEALELCRRVLESPARSRNEHWGDDFIAHRCQEHPELQEEVARLRESSSNIAHARH